MCPGCIVTGLLSGMNCHVCICVMAGKEGDKHTEDNFLIFGADHCYRTVEVTAGKF